jgi:hypothetical protein
MPSTLPLIARFIVITPEVIICWNKLPQSLIDIRTCQAFKKNLEAYLTFNSITSL